MERLVEHDVVRVHSGAEFCQHTPCKLVITAKQDMACTHAIRIPGACLQESSLLWQRHDANMIDVQGAILARGAD